jgi:hypothetical protein
MFAFHSTQPRRHDSYCARLPYGWHTHTACRRHLTTTDKHASCLAKSRQGRACLCHSGMLSLRYLSLSSMSMSHGVHSCLSHRRLSLVCRWPWRTSKCVLGCNSHKPCVAATSTSLGYSNCLVLHTCPVLLHSNLCMTATQLAFCLWPYCLWPYVFGRMASKSGVL